LPTPNPDTLIKSGWVVKEGHRVANLKERFFVVRIESDGAPMLYYYESENPGSECKGQVNLTGCTLGPTKRNRGMYEHCIRVDLADSEKSHSGFQKLVLCFKSKSEMVAWTTAIEWARDCVANAKARANVENTEAAADKERKEAEEARQKAEEAQKAADEAEAARIKEQKEAEEAEALAAKERAEAEAAEAAAEKEQREAEEARQQALKEQQEAEEAARQAQKEAEEAEAAELAAAKEAAEAAAAAANVAAIEKQIADVESKMQTANKAQTAKLKKQLSTLRPSLEKARKIAEKEAAEAAAAQEAAERERREAEEAAERLAKEQREAEEAAERLAKEQAEADAAAEVARREREEAEAAEAAAAKERAEAEEAQRAEAEAKKAAEAAEAAARKEEAEAVEAEREARNAVAEMDLGSGYQGRAISTGDVQDAEREALYKRVVCEGTELRKFARAKLMKQVSHEPQPRVFKVTGGNMLVWENRNPKKIKSAVAGPSRLLSNIELPAGVPKECCFHVLLAEGGDSVDVLDLVAGTQDVADLWVNGLNLIAKPRRASWARSPSSKSGSPKTTEAGAASP